jgi:formylglycine-generating enzyme required for sulfatase activity
MNDKFILYRLSFQAGSTLMRLFFVLALSFALCGTVSTTRAQTAAPAPTIPENMVLVPAGEFTMGTNQGEGTGPNTPRMNNDAQPEHKVTLPAFYIDKTEVTNAQYKAYCDATGYPAPPNWTNGAFASGEEEFAVTHINWWEAAAYAAWAGKRLPTEAEWEKAARGTDKRTFPWGNDWDVNRVIWNRNRSFKVGTKPDGASPYGALDMAGNVYEWTASWYDAYPNAPHKFAEYGTQMKVIRGGGFYGSEFLARTHYRSVAFPSTRSDWIGFRCAMDERQG